MPSVRVAIWRSRLCGAHRASSASSCDRPIRAASCSEQSRRWRLSDEDLTQQRGLASSTVNMYGMSSGEWTEVNDKSDVKCTGTSRLLIQVWAKCLKLAFAGAPIVCAFTAKFRDALSLQRPFTKLFMFIASDFTTLSQKYIRAQRQQGTTGTPDTTAERHNRSDWGC